MPSTKAARGGIYSGVFLKDIKVPDQARSQGGAWRYLFFQQVEGPRRVSRFDSFFASGYRENAS